MGSENGVSMRRVWLTTFSAILGGVLIAVAILAGISQVTGYSAYTGDELASHYSQRLVNSVKAASATVDKPLAQTPGDIECAKHSYTRPEYDLCVANGGTLPDQSQTSGNGGVDPACAGYASGTTAYDQCVLNGGGTP